MNRFELRHHDKYNYLSVDPLPSKEELKEFYEQIYYQQDIGQYNKKYSHVELEYFNSDCIVVVALFSKQFPDAGKKSFLDIGCGEGFQSNFFLNNNWDVSCFDYSDSGIKHHNPHLLEYFFKDEIEDFLSKLEKNFSIIFLKNVLEHVISPIELLGSIKKIMGKESLLMIDVPNDYSLFQTHLMKIGATENTWFCAPQHLHYFQFDSIRRLLEGEDFEIVSLQAGFPIEQFLVNEHSNYNKNKNTGKSAHLARCEISTFLLNQGVDKYIRLREAYADLDFGRDIIATVKLKE